MSSEVVLRLERQIRKNLGNKNPIGNGLPSTIEEVEMLAKSERNSCKTIACRHILRDSEMQGRMLTETEIREHLACICPSGEAKDEFTRGFKAALEIVLGIHKEAA